MAAIITKNSNTSGSIPSSLQQGELAINVADGKLFYGNGSSVQQFTGGGSSLSASYATTSSYAVTASYVIGGGSSGTPGGSNTQIQYNNSSAFGGVPTLTYDGTTLRGTGSFTGSFTGQLIGTSSWASNTISSSYAVTSSHAVSAKNASTIDISVFGSPVDSYVLMSNVAGTTGVAIGGDADFRYNSSTNVLTVGSVSATSLTGSLLGTASWASNATTASYIQNAISSSFATTASYFSGTVVSASYANTASYVNTLNQNVLITGSLTIGSSSLGASENTLTLGARDNIQEGGQLMLQAPGGTYTSASMFDNYTNLTRLLRGTNAGSDAVVASWNMHTKQMQLPQYTAASSFAGTATANLAVDSSGNVITVSTSGGTVFPYTGNAVITGSLTTTGAVIAQANGAMYFRGGDDAELWDINVANTVGIYGQQDATVASVKLGSGGGTISGKSGNIGIGTTNPTQGTLEVNGNVYATSFTGSLLGTAATASATQLQGGLATSMYPGTYFYPNEPNAITQNINAGGSSDSTNIRYYPFVPSQDTKITGIGKHVRGTLTTNTGSYRLGVYASVQGNLGAGPVPLPGALVGDYGIVSFPGTTPAFVEITISAGSQPTLQKGKLYWLACSPSGSTTFAIGPSNATQYNKFMGTAAPAATALSAANVGLQQASDGGAALPNPAATSSISLINSSGLVLAPFLKISGSTLSY